MPSESDRGPSPRGAAAPPTLDQAMQRIEALEERLARLESVLSVNSDGSVQMSATGQLRIVATNHILLEAGANFVELSIVGAEVAAAGQLKLNAAETRVQSGMVNVSAAMSQFSGVVRSDTLVTNTVVASTYTPGAGNLM